MEYQRGNDTFMARNHQRTLSTNEIVGGEPNLKLFLTLQKSAENENINFIRVSFFLLEVARSESKGGDYDEGASSQEIKISRQLQNFFLSLSLIVLIKTMTRNHVVGG